MGFREQIGKSPVITGGFGVLVLIGALAAIWMQTRGPSMAGMAAYFTEDDGVTFFADETRPLVPFQREGKTVVQACVFQCPGQKPYVGYMLRFPADQKVILEKVRNRKPTDAPPSPQELGTMMMPPEIKYPGKAGWNRENSTGATMNVLAKKCPDGTDPVRISEQ